MSEPNSFQMGQLIGEQVAGLKALNASFDQHCEDDERRHRENVELLKENTDAIVGLKTTLEALAATVTLMKPGYKMTRTRLAMLAWLGFSIVALLGWLAEASFKWAVAKLLTMKFGS